uniref:large ribosomal subunit protein mL49 n=1 Tax=Myxine glutinosa TaxID=7769 RepID=UPI00358EA0B4
MATRLCVLYKGAAYWRWSGSTQNRVLCHGQQALQLSCRRCSEGVDLARFSGFTRSPEDFVHVERLIPPSIVPRPPKHAQYPTPSGWQPPCDPPPSLPYTVRRTRMHNPPVYERLRYLNQKVTTIRKIEGDIWELEKDIKTFLEQEKGEKPAIQVNEVTMIIAIKGHFGEDLKQWLFDKGF